MSNTTEIRTNTLEEAKDMLRIVMENATALLEKAVDSGAINLNDPKYTEILLGKIVAKACLNSSIANNLQVGNREKDVKNINAFI